VGLPSFLLQLVWVCQYAEERREKEERGDGVDEERKERREKEEARSELNLILVTLTIGAPLLTGMW
jgi:hypothetical protein